MQGRGAAVTGRGLANAGRQRRRHGDLMEAESRVDMPQVPKPSHPRSRHAWPSVMLAVVLGLAAASVLGQPLPLQLQELLAQQRLTGLVWSMVEGGHVRTGAAGFANAGTRAPMTADTRVQVGSVAKTLLALAVLKRVSDGALDLDDPVATLLPELRIDNPWAATHPLRLRHLLDMTGGLEDRRLHHMFSARISPDLPLRQVFEELDPPLVLRTPPGSQFSYSNLSFTLAAHALEASTGQRYEDWAAQHLLRPLGMHHSSFHAVTPTSAAGDGLGPVAWGHLEDGRPMIPPPLAVRPAALFMTTAADMGRLATFLLAGAEVHGRPLIRPDLLGQVGLATSTHAWAAGLRTGYGLGMFTRDRAGAVGRCHGGSVAGFRAMFCTFHAAGKAFFVAHNTDDERARYTQFDEALIRALDVGDRPPPSIPRPAPGEHEAWSGFYVPSPSRMAQLALVDQLTAFWRLRMEGGRASIRQGLGPSRQLAFEGGQTYRQDDRVRPDWALLGHARAPGLTNGYVTLRRVPGAVLVVLWTVVVSGAASLLWWLAVPIVRHARGIGVVWRQPAWWCVAGFVASAALMATKDWRTAGDLDAVSLAVFTATLALPAGFSLQAVQLLRTPARARRSGKRDLAMLLAGGTMFVLLFMQGLLPLALWRL